MIQLVQTVMRSTNPQRSVCSVLAAAIGCTALTSGCATSNLYKRKEEVKTASGPEEDLADRFGLTADAQDPSQRDDELGYGRWKQKPETEGTASPTSPKRRQIPGT